jgi:hypothetical protein
MKRLTRFLGVRVIRFSNDQGDEYAWQAFCTPAGCAFTIRWRIARSCTSQAASPFTSQKSGSKEPPGGAGVGLHGVEETVAIVVRIAAVRGSVAVAVEPDPQIGLQRLAEESPPGPCVGLGGGVIPHIFFPRGYPIPSAAQKE